VGISGEMPLPSIFSRKKDKTVAVPAAAAAPPEQDPVTAMFEKFKEADEDKIGPEGIMNLCEQMRIEPTDVRLLILAWQLKAEVQGYFSRAEWLRGVGSLHADSPILLLARLDSLLTQLHAAKTSPAFRDFYKFSFRFSRTPGQKSLESESVVALLPMVLGVDHPHCVGLTTFLEASPTIRGFNEDQWTSFLLFSNEIKPDFSNFDPDGAWPSMLDDYVTHARA